MRLEIPSDEGGLCRARTAVEDFLRVSGLDADTEFVVMLALEEVVTNVLKYSGAPQGACRIAIAAEVVDGAAALEFPIDNGCAFDPLQAPEPDLDLPLEERPIGGLGIHLLRNLTQTISYERREGRNVLRLVFPSGARQGEV